MLAPSGGELGWHLEEIHVTWTHLEKKRTRLRTYTKIHQEVLFTECGDGIRSTKRHHHDLSGDGVWILATPSQRMDLSQKDKNKANSDKTEYRNGMSTENQSQRRLRMNGLEAVWIEGARLKAWDAPRGSGSFPSSL
ncbi:hypothetical protein Tco_1180405 [Tanacetum coccineum]